MLRNLRKGAKNGNEIKPRPNRQIGGAILLRSYIRMDGWDHRKKFGRSVPFLGGSRASGTGCPNSSVKTVTNGPEGTRWLGGHLKSTWSGLEIVQWRRGRGEMGNPRSHSGRKSKWNGGFFSRHLQSRSLALLKWSCHFVGSEEEKWDKNRTLSHVSFRKGKICVPFTKAS